MRAFVAVDIPPARRDGGGELPRAPEHITLRFLGEVEESAVPDLAARLGSAVGSLPRFEFVLEGTGAFPSNARPRVVWQGVGQGAEELVALARTVRAAVEEAGLPEDPAPFVPHATLFRVRSSRDFARAKALLSGAAPALPSVRVLVADVALKSSVLGPGGALHRDLARFPLRGSEGER